MSAFGKKRFQAMAPLAGSMSGVTLAGPTVTMGTKVVAVDMALQATDSGKLILLSPSVTASLPSAVGIGGTIYNILLNGNPSGLSTYITSALGGGMAGGFVSVDGGTVTALSPGVTRGINLLPASTVGDQVTIVSDGTNWYVRGMCKISNSVAYTV